MGAVRRKPSDDLNIDHTKLKLVDSSLEEEDTLQCTDEDEEHKKASTI